MPKNAYDSQLLDLKINKRSGTPMWKQVYDAIRESILNGQLRYGDRLMSSRKIAEKLNISRVTVLSAFGQLHVEGYLSHGVGKGTFVNQKIPDQILQLSTGQNIALTADKDNIETKGKFGKFFPGVPDIDEFPFDKWTRVTSKVVRQLPKSVFNSYDYQGYLPLREEISKHLRKYRGLSVTASDILVTNGISNTLSKICNVLLNKGDVIWMEDPSYGVARELFITLGLKIKPLNLEAEEIVFPTIETDIDIPKAIYLTPCHQFPLGYSLSLEKRLQLIEIASKYNTMLIEDDYDSIYRFSEKPIPALHGLSHGKHVIYLGSFSKILFLGLRISFYVIPRSYRQLMLNYQRLTDKGQSIVEQAILAEFMNIGYFDQHVRKTRVLYHQRYELMSKKLLKHLSDHLIIKQTHTGIHFVAYFKKNVNDIQFASVASKSGFDVIPLSSLYIDQHSTKKGFVIGYGNVTEPMIVLEMKKLVRTINEYMRNFGYITK